MILINNQESIQCQWQDHFIDLLNHDSHVEANSLYNGPAVLVRDELDDVIHL